MRLKTQVVAILQRHECIVGLAQLAGAFDDAP